MKLYDDMTAEERLAFHDSLAFKGGRPMAVASKFPDGRWYDWDPILLEVVEHTPSGDRFVVELRGAELVRVRALSPELMAKVS